MPGGYDADIEAALGGIFQRSDQLVVGYQIGGGDIDVFPGVVYHIEIDHFAHIFPVKRGVAVGDDKASCILLRQCE